MLTIKREKLQKTARDTKTSSENKLNRKKTYYLFLKGNIRGSNKNSFSNLEF